MKQLFYLFFVVFCISLSAYSGSKKASSDSEQEALNIDYSKPTYFRGKVKQLEMKEKLPVIIRSITYYE